MFLIRSIVISINLNQSPPINVMRFVVLLALGYEGGGVVSEEVADISDPEIF